MNTHLDLFSGVGGFALAAGWAGFKTVAFCEIDEYAQRVLIKNFGAVMADADGARQSQSGRSVEEFGRRVGNGGENVAHAHCNRREARAQQEASESSLQQVSQGSCPRIYCDIRQLDGTQFKGVDLLTAGVPCQPASCAGKRRGKADDRWLWPEALRILREAAPAWAVFENPCGILSLESGVEFEHLLSEMESYGYSVQPIIVPACAVDARHRRDRVWIVAVAAGRGRKRGRINGRQAAGTRASGLLARPSENMALAVSAGLEERQEQSARQECPPTERSGDTSFSRWPDEAEWFAQSGMGRVASRVPNRVDRLRCLGNSVVPQVAYEILKLIANSR